MNITALLLASVQTFCNPMSIPDTPISHECWKLKHGDIIEKDKLPAWSYNSWQYEENGVKKARQFREIGEPEVLVEGNVWYLYVSSGLMWKSDDCGGTWRHIRLQEHSEYAPTCVKFRGCYYLTVSYSPLMVADTPEGPFKSLGHFERKTFGGDPDMASFGDPALFADGDRLYLYWGCVSPSKSLWGCELDADHPTRAKTPAKRIMSLDPVKYPWMRPPLEGAYMFKRGDTYYFSNACQSPKGYCFVVWKGRDPLGPFEMQEKNPAFATARGNGLAWNTGHGSIYRDQYGDWWINYCIWPMDKKFHAFEKFIGQDRIEFEANGDLKVSSATCEPQWLPSSGKRGPTGWKRLPAKTAFPKAADDHLRTYAEFAPGSNEMTFEFDGVKELHAYRVIWCDLGLDENRGVKRGPYRYRVDCRSDGVWRTWYDASANDTELICDYREAPVVCADAVRLVLVGAPKGLTAAVTEFTAFGLAAGTVPKRMSDLDLALEAAHSNLVSRFVGADGLLRGWEAPDPTPRDCAEGRPSYIGWATPVENAPMFTGLWMPAVCERARRTGRPDDRELARRMATGLLKVASVSDVKGFIARGTATDGRSHYPWGSTDQTGPWYLGLYAYLQSNIPTADERRQIAAKVAEVTDALEARAWKLPCDGVFKDRETCGDLKNETEGRYRETSQYLFMLKAAAVMTGDAKWEKRFRAELNGRPNKCRLTRLQILEEGYAIDLPHLNVEPLLLWIYVHQHVMHAELVRLEADAKIRERMMVGLVRDARRAARFIDVPQRPPRVREVPYSAADWSKFVTWSPQKTMMEAKHVAWTLTAEGKRRKGEERAAVQLPLSAAVIAAYSGDAAARNQARLRIRTTDFSALNLSDFFLAEVWASACRHADALLTWRGQSPSLF